MEHGVGGVRMKIFQRVNCKGYLKKARDGIFLNCEEVNGDVAVPAKGNMWGTAQNIKVTAMQNIYENGKWAAKVLKDLSGFDGDSVLKTYHERVEEPFSGFLVGFTNIIISADIGTDWFSDYSSREWFRLTKHPHYTKVGVVFFKNNAKRYVLPEDIIPVDEYKEGGAKWIPVDDRLPSVTHEDRYDDGWEPQVYYDSDPVLVWAKGKDRCHIGVCSRYYSDGEKTEWDCYDYEDNLIGSICEVLAWMPLPKPYREGAEDGNS